MNKLFGLPIHSNPLIPDTMPVLQLSSTVNVSDAFRAEMNQWLLDTFGVKQVAFIVDMQALGLYGDKALFMSPRSFGILNFGMLP